MTKTAISRVLPLTFREVDENRWDDFERLFASTGGPKSCWCMVWRATGTESRQTKGPERKAAMCGRLRVGKSFVDLMHCCWSELPCVRPLDAALDDGRWA